MTTQESKRKLTAILSADVKGYSRLMSQDEEATVKTLKQHRITISGLVSEHRGRVVDSPGDNILAEFGSVVDAVKCAVKIQETLKGKNAELPENRRMDFRIGVNLGDVIDEEDRIYGDGVNIAARLEGLAEAGSVCISGTAFDQVKNKLSVGYQYLGKQTVKNIPDPVRAYKVLMAPEAAGKVIGEKKPKQIGWGWKALAAVAVLVLVTGGLIWNFYLQTPNIEPASAEKMAFPLPDKPSIAVLPFMNMSGDPAQDYISDGLTDYIITNLSSIPHLFVIASNSTFTYKGKPVKVQRVAEDLGVQYVLEGSVQQAKNRARVSVQLVDALSGRHLWAESYDRSLDDLFALQDEITMRTITSLQVSLAEGTYASAAGKSTKNLKALQSYWQADYHYLLGTAEDNALARQYAEKAVEMDPQFSTAWALLGFVSFSDALFGASKSPAESLKLAEEYAQKAIALNDSCAKAYILVGALRWVQRKYEEAIKYGEKAVALNPNDPHMLAGLALTMHVDGRFEESVALYKKAMRLSPSYPTWLLRDQSVIYIMAGRYEEAIAASKLLLSRSDKSERDAIAAHRSLAQAYIALGRSDEARLHIEEGRKVNPKVFNLPVQRQNAMRYYRDPADAERFIALLQKAGLK
jgi:adenylate cyclase